MFRSQMGILLNHPDVFPTAHFLQSGNRNAGTSQLAQVYLRSCHLKSTMPACDNAFFQIRELMLFTGLPFGWVKTKDGFLPICFTNIPSAV